MSKTDDRVALDLWYAVETLADIGDAPRRTRLLGQDITCLRQADGRVAAHEAEGRPLPVRERYGCLWTSLGAPVKEIFDIAEAGEADRRFVPCGWTRIRASGPRVVENFLDMAHFPFVHPEILGTESRAEVPHYQTGIARRY